MFKQQVSFVVMAVDNFHKKQLNPIVQLYYYDTKIFTCVNDIKILFKIWKFHFL